MNFIEFIFLFFLSYCINAYESELDEIPFLRDALDELNGNAHLNCAHRVAYAFEPKTRDWFNFLNPILKAIYTVSTHRAKLILILLTG